MNSIFIKKYWFLWNSFAVSLIIMMIATSFTLNKVPGAANGTLKIRFINTANGKPVVLRDSVYSNVFGEQYQINKLKYYISNVSITNSNGKTNFSEDCHLIDAANEENIIEIPLQAGKYDKLKFLLGVDSIRNCSGAQTGALDPMNGMFWTWNSGYIMFKLEGNSTASTADLQRIEHHIGGYKGSDNVATVIQLDFNTAKNLEIKAGATTELVLETNLDNYWHGNAAIKIAELPMCMITGEPALKVAKNFTRLFSVKEIHQAP